MLPADTVRTGMPDFSACARSRARFSYTARELTRRVALSHRPELIERLEACVARMRRKGPDSALADREFHDLICAELARELTGLFWDVYRAAESELGGPTSSPANTAKRHQLIVDALICGDADVAAEAAHRHFDEVRKRAKAGRYGDFGEARHVP
jgi:DNA-binding FadR family transcriptional regulator